MLRLSVITTILVETFDALCARNPYDAPNTTKFDMFA